MPKLVSEINQCLKPQNIAWPVSKARSYLFIFGFKASLFPYPPIIPPDWIIMIINSINEEKCQNGKKGN
jgi:hypothetical protein